MDGFDFFTNSASPPCADALICVAFIMLFISLAVL